MTGVDPNISCRAICMTKDYDTILLGVLYVLKQLYESGDHYLLTTVKKPVMID
jgi:hypothetical protein